STTAVANGGTKANTTEASTGGAGAIGGTSAATISALTAGNGGGGGGGVGRIVYRGTSLGGLQSSPAAVVP
ncbi:MAG: collagen-like triple helix repeat-containing lipoprotein, partial [Polyangiales bacterium]